jgi:hypothetical protein
MLLYNTLYYICYFIVLVCYTSRPTLEFGTGTQFLRGRPWLLSHMMSPIDRLLYVNPTNELLVLRP